jgi:hypothetical protein
MSAAGRDAASISKIDESGALLSKSCYRELRDPISARFHRRAETRMADSPEGKPAISVR